MFTIDEWSGFADPLANLIEKYVSELEIENMSAPLAMFDRMDSAEVDEVSTCRKFRQVRMRATGR